MIDKMSELFKVHHLPGPSAIYPRLNELEKSGFIEVAEKGKRGKKIYEITEEGLDYLDKNEEELDKIIKRLKTFGEISQMGGKELGEALHLVGKNFEKLDDGQKEQIEEALDKCQKKIRLVVEFGEDVNEILD